jgi:hypothetical protein
MVKKNTERFQSTMLLACHCFTGRYIFCRIKQICPVSEGYLRKSVFLANSPH